MMKNNLIKRKNPLFTRMTLMMVLGIFTLLSITVFLSASSAVLLARYTNLVENSLLTYSLVIMVISIIVGILLSFVYSAIMVRVSQPYIEALQRIAACDFSVRIKDTPILSGFAIADNFNDMARQLASVETLREDFISNFSHEFKTPIVSISGFATLLKNPKLTKEEREEYLDVIIDESSRLVRLSESVLTLTRLDSQKIVKEPFALDEHIRQSMLLFQRTASTKNIEMTAELDSVTVISEKKLVSQIWVNLLSNAIKFTPNGGTIEVTTAIVGNRINVSVRDSGCGMDEETKSHIFNKFFQGDSSRHTEGNGLGLSVVQKICTLLGLEISVESQPDKGSTFTVSLPLQSAQNVETDKSGQRRPIKRTSEKQQKATEQHSKKDR